MKVLLSVLTFLWASVQGGLLSHSVDERLHGDSLLHHGINFHHGGIHHNSGIHVGHSARIVVDGVNRHTNQHELVFHHTDHNTARDVHHNDVHHNVDEANSAKIVHHEPIHQVERVHHVTKVVHHEPHHFLHYTSPVVDHHVVHQNRLGDELHAADLPSSELHHVDAHHHGDFQHIADADSGTLRDHSGIHHHRAELTENAHFLHHNGGLHHHAALIQHSVPSVRYHHNYAHTHKDQPIHDTHTDIVTIANHHLNRNYGKVKITEKHY